MRVQMTIIVRDEECRDIPCEETDRGQYHKRKAKPWRKKVIYRNDYSEGWRDEECGEMNLARRQTEAAAAAADWRQTKLQVVDRTHFIDRLL